MSNIFTQLIAFSIFIHQPAQANFYFNPKNNSDTIPSWVEKLYTVDTADNGYPQTKIIYFKQLTDSTSYAIVEYHSGTGVSTFVATQKKRKDFKNMDIGSENDSDEANPIYSSSTYRHDSLHNMIFVTIDDEIAKSKFTFKKNNVLTFKNGYDMSNAETYERITKQTLKIFRSGNIKIIELHTR